MEVSSHSTIGLCMHGELPGIRRRWIILLGGFAVAGDRSGFARRDDWATAAIDDTNIPATFASLSDHEAPHIVSPRAEIRQRCSSKSVFGSAAYRTCAGYTLCACPLTEGTAEAYRITARNRLYQIPAKAGRFQMLL